MRKNTYREALVNRLAKLGYTKEYADELVAFYERHDKLGVLEDFIEAKESISEFNRETV